MRPSLDTEEGLIQFEFAKLLNSLEEVNASQGELSKESLADIAKQFNGLVDNHNVSSVALAALINGGDTDVTLISHINEH